MTELPFGLIGISSAFENRVLFTQKINAYLGSVQDTGIIAINDVSGMASQVLGDRLIDSLPPAMALREKRRLVRSSKFAVFFWDGTGLEDFIYLTRLYEVPAKIVPVETTRVVNRDRDEFDVYIGRGTPWGNPFAIGEKGADRAAVIEMYKEYFVKKFVDDPAGNRDIRSLKGKVLGCHCKPSACHGDVIAKYLNSLVD
jgi:hypothetical protein